MNDAGRIDAAPSCAACGEAIDSDGRFCAGCGAAVEGYEATESGAGEIDRHQARPDDTLLGTEVAGYRIERVIGRGGMGVVYEAVHLELYRRAAIKVVAPELASDDRFRERFVSESRAAAAIDHPNILPLYEAGESDGLLFIAARLVEGTDLRTLLIREGSIDLPFAVSLIDQIGAALNAAHERDLVHRDVKPANILVTPAHGPGGRAHFYLTDFGLSKRISSDSGLTQSGQFVGTLSYVAPEQVEGRHVDGRADVYALGCVLYESLAGRPPFEGEAAALLWAHMNGEIPKLSDVQPDLPPMLDEVIALALAKDPEKRFQTCGALAAAAAEAARIMAPAQPPTRDPVKRPRPSRSPDAATTRALPPEAPDNRRRRLRLGLAAVAGALVIATAVVGVTALGGDSDGRRGAASGPAGAQPTSARAAVADSDPLGSTYTASVSGYTARFPAGWKMESDDVDKGGFRRTKFVPPNGDGFILIDTTKGGAEKSPAESAQEIEADISQTERGYRRLSFSPTAIGSREGFEWRYQRANDRGKTEQRLDLLLSMGNDGFAVYAGGVQALRLVRSVAASLKQGD